MTSQSSHLWYFDYFDHWKKGLFHLDYYLTDCSKNSKQEGIMHLLASSYHACLGLHKLLLPSFNDFLPNCFWIVAEDCLALLQLFNVIYYFPRCPFSPLLLLLPPHYLGFLRFLCWFHFRLNLLFLRLKERNSDPLQSHRLKLIPTRLQNDCFNQRFTLQKLVCESRFLYNIR